MQTNPTTDPFPPALLGFLGAIVGSGVSIATSWLLNRHARLMQNAQWATEDRRAEKAAAKADKDKDSDARSLARRELLEQYGQIAAGLARLMVYADRVMLSDQGYQTAIGETEQRLAMFVATFPDKNHPKFVELVNLQTKKADLRTENHFELIRRLVYELVPHDPRIKDE